MAVVEQSPRSATAKARQPSAVYFIPRAEMVTLIENCPSLALSLLQLISHRLRDFNQHYLHDLLQAERLAVLGRFARGIVHDLKNPLNVIGLAAQTICLPGTTEEFLRLSRERIQQQVERVNDLISELLLFTQGPRPGLLLERLDYAQVLRELVSELQVDLRARNCQLELEGDVPLVRLRLDPKRLRRVLINLTNNAADATGPGGLITLRCSLGSSNIVTVMEDNGAGIAPEMVDKLFEAFATHGKPHGTGLGLAICKKFIEDHGGRIWASNRPQGGASFSFELPLLKEASST